jgi:hypothetical protein
MARYCTRENEPLKKWNGIPIYLTTIITALFVVGFLVSAILLAMRSPLFETLTFSLPGDFTNFFSALTYPFFDYLSFFTPFGIFFFYRFAVGIETHLGRRVLAKLLLLLTLVPVALSTLMFYGFGVGMAAMGMGGRALMGDFLILVGVIIAFSTLYPNAEAFGWISFKLLAFVCLLCGSLLELAERNWLMLTGLWLSAAMGFFLIRQALEQEHDDVVPVMARVRGWFRRKPRLRALPSPTPPVRPTPVRPRKVEEEDDVEIDALLDKIAKNGLASLTSSEKAKLERARQELLKKERL